MTSDKVDVLRSLASEITKLAGTASGLDNPMLVALLDRARQEIEAELTVLPTHTEPLSVDGIENPND